MAEFRSRLTFGNVAGATALFVALGGGAYAAAQNPFVSAGGTIHGCVAAKGVLMVVQHGSKCPARTVSLPFSQTGPRGLPGVNGKNGINGTNGKDGAVAGYSAMAGTGSVDFTSQAKTIVQKSLPTGNYILTGKVEVDAVDDGRAGGWQSSAR